MVLVDQRPVEVETRLIVGHYEGELVMGSGNRSAVGVLVDCTTVSLSCAIFRKRTQPWASKYLRVDCS